MAVVTPALNETCIFCQRCLKARLRDTTSFSPETLNRYRRPCCTGLRSSSSILFTSVSLVIDLDKDIPRYSILNRKVANFILQHARPESIYRHLPARSGFRTSNLEYSFTPDDHMRQSNLIEGFDRAVKLLVSTTNLPMRLVTSLSLFGAVATFCIQSTSSVSAYSRPDVEPGWVSLSLQQSGMFFLISLVLLVLGEYILNMARLSNEGPGYQVAQEFTSAVMHCGKSSTSMNAPAFGKKR